MIEEDYVKEFEETKKMYENEYEYGGKDKTIGAATAIIQRMQREIEKLDQKYNRMQEIAQAVAAEGLIFERLKISEIMEKLNLTDSEVYKIS